MKSIGDLMREGVVLGDGGYLIELERRGYVSSGSDRGKVGTGRGSGQFTPEVAIENPTALCELHREFLNAGSQVLQALTFFGTREKLGRAGYGEETERINREAVRLARETAAGKALVAGSVSRTQLIERMGMDALGTASDHLAEQMRFLKDAGVDFLILETFFHLAEMKEALRRAAEVNLPAIATMSFRPWIAQCSDGASPAECARVMTDGGAIAVGANCEQDPSLMRTLVREMREATSLPIAVQPAAFRTTDQCQSFTRLPEFPDRLETIQVARELFEELGREAAREGIRYLGGCCGCNAAYIRSLARGLNQASS